MRGGKQLVEDCVVKQVSWVLLLGSFFAYTFCAAAWAGGSEPAQGVRFELGAGRGGFEAWGRGKDTRWFFPEFLPALFERRLVLDDVELAGGRLEWIFTGERGGFTITLNETTISLTQRFYDSPGFNAVTGETPRHPQWETPPQSVKREGRPGEIAVVLDHQLGLAVRADGREVLHQECLFDVSRHQLRLAGKDADKLRVAGRLLVPPVQEVQIRVNPDQVHQEIIGFGGIATPTAYAQLSPQGKDRWWKLLREYNFRPPDIAARFPSISRVSGEMMRRKS
jgi:hypothetical protein